jgi:hypothetical protein
MSLISRKVLKRRPQELGKIKIGGKGAEKTSSGGNKFRMPVKYDHFVVTTRDRGKDDNFLRDERIHEHPAVGEAPTELAGILMYDRPDENFHAEFCQYKGRTKVWTCDGETATNLKTGATGTCAKSQDKECKCKPYGRLHLQLWASGHVLGYHVFRTTSWESVNNIQTALEEIHERFGTLLHAPVKLVLYPAEDSYTENGKEKTSHSWKVGLVLAMSMEEAARRMVEAKRQLDVARSELRLLAGEVTSELDARDAEEMDDIAEEFFPDEAVLATVETQQRLDALKAELCVDDEDPEIVDAHLEQQYEDATDGDLFGTEAVEG